MAEMWNGFLTTATNNMLRGKCRELNLQTSGNKASLILRLQSHVGNFSEDELTRLVPKNFILISNDNENQHNNDENERNNESEEEVNDIDTDEDENHQNGNDEDVLDNEVEKLKRILEKQKEILKLKRKIQEIQVMDIGITPRTATYTFKDVEDSVPGFNGDDNFPIQRWIQQFEESMDVMNIDEKSRFVYSKRLLTGTAKLFIRSISTKSWRELKEKLLKEFKKNITKADIHNALRSRKKRREETMQQYVLCMQEIASSGAIEEDDMMQYIISGIPDSEANKMILHSADNMDELKIGLRKYEKLKINSHDSSKSQYKFDSSKIKIHQGSMIKNIKCYNCNEPGHLSRVCPKLKRSEVRCFKCGKVGHKSPDCQGLSISKNAVMAVNAKRGEMFNSCSCGDSSGSDLKIETNQLQQVNHKFEYFLRYDFYKDVDVCNMHLRTLLDTGSPISFIQQQLVPEGLLDEEDPGNYSFCGLNNSPLVIIGSIKCKISFDGKVFNFKLLVVKKYSMLYPVILGRNFLEENNLVLQKENKNLRNDMKKDRESFAHASGSSEESKIKNDNTEELQFLKEVLNIDVSDISEKINLKINESLPISIKNRIVKIVEPAWFLKEQKFNPRDDFQMKIILTKQDPFYCHPRRLPYAHKIELKKILDDLLEKGIIRESSSPYASPIVLVQKKNKEFRLCIDYRELNKVTQRDNYPLPLIEDHLDRLKNKRIFTTLDFKNGFHHVKLTEDSVKYTSFITPIGQFEYIRMPFGLKNAPSVFERYMKFIFGDLIASGKILTFLDDILIATETVEENLQILSQVINTIEKNGLLIRWDKCSFLEDEITYLGYRIDKRGIRPSDEHLKAIKDFPVPTCTKDVHSFLGLCSYFRKFIKDFARIGKPLYDLIRKDVPFIFSLKEHDAFEQLKNKLIESPVLSIFSPHNETELHCDGSGIGYGAVLMQKQLDGKFHPVFYFSKRATDTESRYHSYEQETLAIIYSLRRFRIYLIGIKFKIITDCQSFTLTMNKKMLNPRISRWALELQSFDYSLEHRSGDRMKHADSLSRSINILQVNDGSFEYVLAAVQKQDPEIMKIASELEKSESSSFEMIDGLIYRKIKDKICFYVPSHMETQVIRTHHEDMCHLGVEKCFDLLSRTYWFPKMKEKVRDYIKTCLKCMYFSSETGKKEGTLHCIPKGCIPFDTLHVDHLGPFANTSSRKQHIFLLIDGFTKFVKLYPVKSTQSKEAIECLKSFFNNYSRPNRLVSDRGTCFSSTEFNEFMLANNIEHIKIATHSPQSNGQIERVNRVLISMLAKKCEENTTIGWDKHVARIEFALNNTLNRSTGFTPSMLLFGRNQKGKFCDRVKEYLEENLNKNDLNLVSLRKQAEQNIGKSQEYNKLYYDKRHKKPKIYSEGDYVLIKNVSNVPGINKKLFAKYRGPYEVEKVLSHDRYVLKDIQGLQLTRVPYKGVCAPQNMKPFCVTQEG